MRAFIAWLLSAWMLAGLGFAQDAARARTDNVEASLVAETDGVAPGGTVTVALRLAIRDHWHTYWSYAGDSGEATTVAWTLPDGVTAGPLQFPYPHRIEVGPLVNFGYEGTVLHLTDITVPADAQPGQTLTLKADAVWLVCSDVCIPEDAALALDLKVVAGTPSPSPLAAEFADARAKLPKPSPWPATFAVDGKSIAVSLASPDLAGAGLTSVVLFPREGGYIKNAAKQTTTSNDGAVTVTSETGRHFSTPEKAAKVTSLPAVFVITGADGQTDAFTVDATRGEKRAGAVVPGAGGQDATGVGPQDGVSVWTALGFALLGGLILNLMPCVFPVLSMKALSLAGKGSDLGAARIGGLAYTAGVVLSFVALAGMLIALRSAGEAIGWGFQLQSPAIVAALALLFLAIGLNLMGVFEIGGRLQNLGSGLARGQGVTASFLTGVLAAVVAAPCTAPFMGAAVFTALTQPVPVALAIFGALGFGMALPYLILAYSPALIRRFPKPGPWMERLKQVLAFPMFASAAWLLWVLSIAAGSTGLALGLGAAILVGFGLWLWGLTQRGEGGWMARGFAGAAAAAVLGVLFVVPQTSGSATAAAPGADTVGPKYEAYSPERLASLRQDGKAVFVNLTAAWCVTCLMNEEVALSSSRLATSFENSGIVYLKGDWTNRDPDITALLEQHGRAGVPLYLFYPAGGGEPQILPQLLTEEIVLAAVSPPGT